MHSNRFSTRLPRWVPLTAVGLALGTQACAMPLAQRPGYVAHNTVMDQVGVVTVQNQSGYQSYHANTLADTKGYTFVRRARGEACQRGIGLPFSVVRNLFSGGRTDTWFTADVRWGEGSLHQAMEQATATMSEDEALVDITIDLEQTSVLTVLYRAWCVVVRGTVVAPPMPPVVEPTELPVGESGPSPA